VRGKPNRTWPDNCTAVLIGPGLASPDLPESLRAFVRKWWLESSVAIIVAPAR